MILSQKEIMKAFLEKQIFYHSNNNFKISDFCKNQSVDVHLGQHLYLPNSKLWVDLLDYPEGFEIESGLFFLAYTDEFIGTTKGSNLHPQIYLR